MKSKTIGNPINLGLINGNRGNPQKLLPNQRGKHLYVCGGTGTGKSKLLEFLIRQDILNWSDSKCGLILIDPHGSLYDSLIRWLAWNDIKRPVIPIDFRQADWIVGYNPLRPRTGDSAVLVDNLTDGLAHVWGASGTNQTPLFARWAGNVLQALYENNLTIVEAEHLLNRVAKQVRFAMTSDLEDNVSRQDWAFADTLSAKDFENQIGSTVNRIRRFITTERMKVTFGQPTISLDLEKAMREGSIILVSLATQGAKISAQNAKTFGTLLLSDLWTAAQEGQGKGDHVKPTYVYVDEFQNFVSPTIAENLDQARGFGLHLTMANQFPGQLLGRGEAGAQLHASIMENASSKVVFRLSHTPNLQAMAEWLFRGVMNPDEIKHQLFSTKVMRYREEWRTSYSHSKGTSKGGGEFDGTTDSKSEGGKIFELVEEDPNNWNKSLAQSNGTSATWTDSENYSETQSSVLIPEMGQELSGIQFRSLEEQLFRAMAVLFDQKERHNVTRIVGSNAPMSLQTPTIPTVPARPDRVKRYLDRCYEKWPFALRYEQALKQVTDRERTFAPDFLKKFEEADAPQKRRINR